MSRTNGWAVFWAVAAGMVATFGQELAAGRVPLPDDWRWVTPVLVAGIAALSPYIDVPRRQ